MDPIKKDWIYLTIGIIIGVSAIRLLLWFFRLA